MHTEFFFTSWFGSGLWEEWPDCREEMTPEDHPECWISSRPLQPAEPHELGRAWPGAALETSQDGESSRDPEQPLVSSTQGPVPQSSWVVFQEGGSPPQNPGSTGRSKHRDIVCSEQNGVAGSMTTPGCISTFQQAQCLPAFQDGLLPRRSC